MSAFREPTGELPEWIERYDNKRYMLSENDDEAVDVVCLTVEKAEALLDVLLDICPNAHSIACARLSATLCNVAHWLERGCDPLQAAKELRLLSGGKTP